MFLTEATKERIVKAIQDAELNTSGEIKVHIEEKCPTDDPIERAKQVFQYLALHKTAQRNGVLFYLAYGTHKFAIWGDIGIDQVVPSNFWEGIRDSMRQYFLQEDFAGGLQMGIREAGNQLKKYFPYLANDVNEISDDISTEPIP
ncbi:TPM domain-containing protein [Emticicia sp. 17c]|uniref:TPM domain-containing protein n=1 Tax=Emticicia sp. 17c TaxID=3127704 RepID=UPI00301BCDF8